MLLTMAAKLSWRLAKIGIQIAPYYWFQEGYHKNALPALRDEADISFGFLDAADLKMLASMEPDAFPNERLAELLERLRRGKQFFGARYRNEIIAMTFIDLDEANFLGGSVHLDSHEAYLGDMFTRERFRGKNVAPHLRYRTYVALGELGKRSFYSYSDAFNPAALRFNEKLQAKVLWVGLYVEIFGKYRWHWKLKNYTGPKKQRSN